MKSILRDIEQLLWKEWDPIGVNDSEEAYGEYDSYALEITSMLERGEGQEAILNHLNFIEREMMGLDPSPTNARIADRALNIHRSRQ